jgi:hypothetical protein
MKKWSELPAEIQEKMLEHQEAQTGKRDASVFEKSIATNSEQMGFNWCRTSEGINFWLDIIDYGKFDLFYERYPKEELRKELKSLKSKVKELEEKIAQLNKN